MSKTTRSASARSERKARSVEVLGQFRLIFGAVRSHHRKIEESCGISGSQLWMLREIDATPGISISTLAARLSIHQSTCSLLVEKLVRGKFAVRKKSPDGDRRSVGLFATKAGISCLGKAPGPAEGLLPKALTELSDASLRSLERELQKIIRVLDVRNDRYRNQPLSSL